MATDDFKELCKVKHEAIDRRVDSIETKVWIVIAGAFVQLLAVVGWFFVTYIAPHPHGGS